MVTLKDVALEAGVSVATASRVLSGTSGRSVRSESAAAVKAAARRLGYRPNQSARSLRLRQTEMVGMVVPHIANPFFAGIVQAVERALQPTGWSLVIGDAQDRPDLEDRCLEALRSRQVDGVIVVPCEAAGGGDALAALATEVPIVQVDRRGGGVDSDWIGVHHRAGIEAAVRHLRESGRRRLTFIGGGAASIAGSERLLGYQSMLADDPTSAESYHLGSFTLDWGMEAVRRLCDGSPPEAIVCGNDLIALGVLRALRERGVHVPDDVAVTGFDDIDFAELSDPPLTTVRQPVEEIGALAVELLHQRLASPESPSREVRLTPELIVRGTTVTSRRVDAMRGGSGQPQV